MRIAIFGGSFDPIHNEHVQLARFAIDELGLDKLFIMPAYAPPHKKGKTLSPDADRLTMCRLACAHLEKAEVSDYEIAKQGSNSNSTPDEPIVIESIVVDTKGGDYSVVEKIPD